MTPQATAECLDGLRRASDEVERPSELGELEISVTPRGRLTSQNATVFAELGVVRLVVIPNPNDDDVRPTIDAAVAAVAGD